MVRPQRGGDAGQRGGRPPFESAFDLRQVTDRDSRSSRQSAHRSTTDQDMPAAAGTSFSITPPFSRLTVAMS